MAVIIDGKAISLRIKEEIKEEVISLKNKGINAGLAVILVGDDPASQIYVRNKKLACEFVGINSYEYILPKDISLDELLESIDKLNNNPDVNGILVQAPVPGHLDYNKIINKISADKDVDAFHPVSVGNLVTGNMSFLPCTPAGIIELIKSTGQEISGKNCVVVGRSNIVGKPMAMLLLRENGTVTICHSKTQNLAAYTKNADILVVAIGKSNFIKGDMIKPGAVVIDVGMNRDQNGKLTGDVEFETASDVAGYITPVPGGVGPMTITMLLKNTLYAAKKQNSIE